MIGFDCSRILDALWVGSHPQSPDDVLHLERQGITAVLNLQSDEDLSRRAIRWELLWRFYNARGLHVERVPIIDFDPEDLADRLPFAVDVLDRLVRSGHRVYVHCNVGINRSPMVAIAWIMREQRLDVEQAVELFQAQRHCVPYPEVLAGWARTLFAS